MGNNLRTIVRTVGSRKGDRILCGNVSNRVVGASGFNHSGAHILERHSASIFQRQGTVSEFSSRTLSGTAAKFL